MSKFTALIFDMGDVLFTWSARTTTNIPPRTLKAMTACPPWQEYERGTIDQATCYDKVGELFSLSPKDIATAFDQARDSLVSNDMMISAIRDLKSSHNLKIFAMSNIALEDYDVLRKKRVDWGVFDAVYTSGGAGERKPNAGFYETVIKESGVDPNKTIFVDDKIDNIRSAEVYGITGIVFDDGLSVLAKLKEHLGNPVI